MNQNRMVPIRSEQPAQTPSADSFPRRVDKTDAVYGLHSVEELLKSRPNQIEQVYVDSERQSKQLYAVLKRCRTERIPCHPVPAKKLSELAGTAKHQGVVALCAVRAYCSMEELAEGLKSAATPPLVFVPASVEDPRNLGSLIRSCVAFGVDAMLLERRHTAPLTPTVAKASAGMVERLQIAKPRNLEGAIGSLRENGFTVVGAEMNAPASPRDIDLTGPTVVITGGEHRGIPPYLRKLCDKLAGIPLASAAPSLNVSVAGAILLYECLSQRTAAG